MGTLLARATRRRTQAHIRHLSPVPPARATGRVGRVYTQVTREFGLLAPPVSLHAPAPDALAACWLMLRETLVASGRADRAVKEAVATAVSLGNTCPYCVDVHGTALHGLVSGPAAAALATGDLDAIDDARIRDVARWALFDEAGGVPPPSALVPELVGVAVTFHYLNRVVNVFLTDSPLPPNVPDGRRAGIRRLVGRVMGPITRRRRTPGLSLDLLPPAPLPDDLAWAAGRSSVAAAFARAAAALDAVGRRCVPEPVCELVEAELSIWDGRSPELTGSTVDDAVAGLAAAWRPAGRLALLTALASYRVTDPVVADYRRVRPDDASLVGLVAWAGMAAARRMGTLLAAPRVVRDAAR